MTSSGHEIELKLRVADRAALLAIAQVAHGERALPVVQRNHFFDSEARALRKAAFGLRLRDEAGRYLLTAKGPSERGGSGALSSRREEEIDVDEVTARAILDGARSPLDVLEARLATRGGAALCLTMRHLVGAAPLRYIGSFENVRTRIKTALPARTGPLDVVLELDETRFPHGHVHFEVEMELDGGTDAQLAETALRDLLHLAGVEGFPSRGKAARFFAALDGVAI